MRNYVFYTITPWEFLPPGGRFERRDPLQRSKQQIPAVEIPHLMHVVLQMVKVFMTGVNVQKTIKWRERLFASRFAGSGQKIYIVLRWEFQEGSRRLDYRGRGTPHAHVLFWIKEPLPNFHLDSMLCGSFPWTTKPRSAAIARRLQQSHKQDTALNEQPTSYA